MSHVVRQFLCRKVRKSGKTDVGKKAQIYGKIEKDAIIILELFVFSLSVGCFDSKELLLIEHVSNNLEMKLQKFWNTCLLINRNAGPQHMLWNEFMESVQIAMKVIVSHSEKETDCKRVFTVFN